MVEEITDRHGDRIKIVIYLSQRPRQTSRTIAHALREGMYTAKGSIPSRIKDLVRMGLVRRCTETELNKHKNPEHLYELTQAGVDAMQLDLNAILVDMGREYARLEKWRAQYLAPYKRQAEVEFNVRLTRKRMELIKP